MKLLHIILFLQPFQLFCQVLIPFQNGEKWGYANENMEILIKPQFKEALEFEDCDLALVRGKRKYFYIDKKGQNTFDKNFDSANSFINGMASVKCNKYNKCINCKGDFVDCNSAYLTDRLVTEYSNYYPQAFYQNGKVGLLIYSIDLEPKLIDSIPPVYDKYLGCTMPSKMAIMRLNGKCGVIGFKNNTLIPFLYDEIIFSYECEILRLKRGALFGFANRLGEVVVEPKYLEIFSNYFTVNKPYGKVKKADHSIGFVNSHADEYWNK